MTSILRADSVDFSRQQGLGGEQPQKKNDWMVQQLGNYEGILCSALRGFSVQVSAANIINQALDNMMPTARSFGLNREQLENLLSDTYEKLYPGTSSRVTEWMIEELTRKANIDKPGFINLLNSALHGHSQQVSAIQTIAEYITQTVNSSKGQKYNLGYDTLFDLLLKTFDRLYPGQRRVYLETHPLPKV